jgi:hypothetical protein
MFLKIVPESKTIRSVTIVDNHSKETRIESRIVIDATYEGDLMAMAGVAWRVGREGQTEYGESLAPKTRG